MGAEAVAAIDASNGESRGRHQALDEHSER